MAATRTPSQPRPADVVLGEDWVGADALIDRELRSRRERRGLFAVNRSPLARKLITFNLIAMLLLVAGVLYLNPFRDSLLSQRETALVTEAELVADIFEAALPPDATVLAAEGDIARLLAAIRLPGPTQIRLFNAEGAVLGATDGTERYVRTVATGQDSGGGSTAIADFLNRAWNVLADAFAPNASRDGQGDARVRKLVDAALDGNPGIDSSPGDASQPALVAAAPIVAGEWTLGAVVLSSADGEIDSLVRAEREQVLQMFVIAIVVSIGLSLVLASTIANPLADLAAAAEIGRDRNSRRVRPSRVRIPDLSGRPDEIGRLSGALRGMVAALYDRIDANEQFAADVAHEIKNPLASLRSAIGSLRFVKKEEQRDKLLDIIEHDVRRLDRLVSDISNASRLDSELVREEEDSFDLLTMLTRLCDHLGQTAKEKGVEFIVDVPREAVVIEGLESRLAQVFVNLISNAISFCEDGDAIRVWARRRENRVLIVVEDTGPGIPEQALTKIFDRFYSQRPEKQFGNNSGLGLAISKQIIEAHGGVIWAENIRPTDADATSQPLGARFVVGLPV